MEIRHAAGPLQRCYASQLNYLAPPPSAPVIAFSLRCRRSSERPVRRNFSSTPQFLWKPNQFTTSGSESTSPKDGKKSTVREGFDSLNRDVWGKLAKTRNLQRGKALQKQLNNGSSNTDLLRVWDGSLSLKAGSEAALHGMILPGGASESKSGKQNVVKKRFERPPMRLKPTTGRTVEIKGNVDVGSALTLLARSCARNKVRRDANSQRFHERPGLKKKRLKSMRWRKLFSVGFKAAVKRVKKLKKLGW